MLKAADGPFIIIMIITIIQIAVFTEHLLCGRYCLMCFTHMDCLILIDTMR